MKYKYLYYFLIFITLFFILYCVVEYSKYFVLYAEDCYLVFSDKTQNFFNNYFGFVYHGRYIANIIEKMQSGVIFDIHPYVWGKTYGALIKGLFLFLFLYLLSSTAFLLNKNKILVPFLIILCYFMYQPPYAFNYTYTAFYGFIFPFIFLFLYWNKLILCFIEEKEITLKENFFLVILAFLLGISTEFTIFITFFSIILVFIISKIIKFDYIKNFYKSFISFYIAVPFYILNPGFIDAAKSKGTLNGINNMLISAQNSIAEYFEISKEVIKNQFLYLTIFIVIVLMLYIAIKLLSNTDKKKETFILKYEISKVLFPVIFLFLCYLFYFLLIFGGRVCGDHHLLAGHFDTNFQIRIMLLYTLFLSFSFFEEFKYSLIQICLLIVFSCNAINQRTEVKDELLNVGLKSYINRHLPVEKDLYKKMYIDEKMLVFYAKNNIRAILPKDIRFKQSGEPQYLEYVYNIKNYNVDYVLVETQDEAYKIYLKYGGEPISDEEIENSDFQALMNKYKN